MFSLRLCQKGGKTHSGDAEYSDGNDVLTDKVRRDIMPFSAPEFFASDKKLPPVSFVFTGCDESAKYLWMLSRLHTEYVPEIFKNKTLSP